MAPCLGACGTLFVGLSLRRSDAELRQLRLLTDARHEVAKPLLFAGLGGLPHRGGFHDGGGIAKVIAARGLPAARLVGQLPLSLRVKLSAKLVFLCELSEQSRHVLRSLPFASGARGFACEVGGRVKCFRLRVDLIFYFLRDVLPDLIRERIGGLDFIGGGLRIFYPVFEPSRIVFFRHVIGDLCEQIDVSLGVFKIAESGKIGGLGLASARIDILDLFSLAGGLLKHTLARQQIVLRVKCLLLRGGIVRRLWFIAFATHDYSFFCG